MRTKLPVLSIAITGLALVGLAGCEGDDSPPEVTLDALCASPDAYLGREIWLRTTIDTSSPVLWTSSASSCTESTPCCNTAEYAFALPTCNGTRIAVAPADPAADPGLLCRGLALGIHPGECALECPNVPWLGAVRALRGTLTAVELGTSGLSYAMRVKALETDPGALPDAGVPVDAGE